MYQQILSNLIENAEKKRKIKVLAHCWYKFGILRGFYDANMNMYP